jgi:molybdopterin converting factor small subunit
MHLHLKLQTIRESLMVTLNLEYVELESKCEEIRFMDLETNSTETDSRHIEAESTETDSVTAHSERNKENLFKRSDSENSNQYLETMAATFNLTEEKLQNVNTVVKDGDEIAFIPPVSSG